MFIMGHLNPILARRGSRTFTCKAIPTRASSPTERRTSGKPPRPPAAEQEAGQQERPDLELIVAKAPAVVQEVVVGGPELGCGGVALDRAGPEEQEQWPDTASRAMPRRRVSRPLRSLKRWP